MKNDLEIDFDAEALIRAVEDVRDHVLGKKKITLRPTQVSMPEWDAELRRRVAEIESGKVETIPAETVHVHVQETLRNVRRVSPSQ